MKKLLLISNRVMHYRVPVYNYFAKRFHESGWKFIVRSDEIQSENPYHIEFDFETILFRFSLYRKEIERIDPDAVILFLHLKDRIIWPLIHWLPFKGIPIINWTKGANLDEPDSRFKYHLFNYVHSKCNRILLYSRNEENLIKPGLRNRIFAANNTINFENFPEIIESPEEIKKDLEIHFDKVVLSVGRMEVGGNRKKIDHLIQIFHGLDRKDVGLVIVGSGVDHKLLEAGDGNIRYLGEVHDPQNIQISRIFRMADVFSIPGHVGLGLNQAFYWGLPMVTEEGLQPPEIHYLVNGRNGFIVPENDIEALKVHILKLIDDDEMRREFSSYAREDILTHGSIENMFMGFKSCADSLFVDDSSGSRVSLGDEQGDQL